MPDLPSAQSDSELVARTRTILGTMGFGVSYDDGVRLLKDLYGVRRVGMTDGERDFLNAHVDKWTARP